MRALVDTLQTKREADILDLQSLSQQKDLCLGSLESKNQAHVTSFASFQNKLEVEQSQTAQLQAKLMKLDDTKDRLERQVETLTQANHESFKELEVARATAQILCRDVQHASLRESAEDIKKQLDTAHIQSGKREEDWKSLVSRWQAEEVLVSVLLQNPGYSRGSSSPNQNALLWRR